MTPLTDRDRPATVATNRKSAPHGLDDALLSAWLRRDDTVADAALRMCLAAALSYAMKLFGGPDKTIRGVSSDDVASIAVARFAREVEDGQLQNANLVGFLMAIVHNEFVDLIRRSKRETSLTGHDGDGSADPSLDVADPSRTPEEALIAHEEFMARRVTLTALRRAGARERVRDWCAWPARMFALCARRPALRAVLRRLQTYIRAELVRAGAPACSADMALEQLGGSVDPERVRLERTTLYPFLQRRLKTNENTVSQRLKALKQLAKRHHVACPQGLMADVPLRGTRYSRAAAA